LQIQNFTEDLDLHNNFLLGSISPNLGYMEKLGTPKSRREEFGWYVLESHRRVLFDIAVLYLDNNKLDHGIPSTLGMLSNLGKSERAPPSILSRLIPHYRNLSPSEPSYE
jgi:hypothetical protein